MIQAVDFEKELQLTVLSPSTKTEWDIRTTDLNRPGMQFCGFYEYFAFERPQVIGKVEMTYLENMEPPARRMMLKKYFSYDMPCVIVCRGMTPPEDLLDAARARNIAVYQSTMVTTKFTFTAINYLNRCLAPRVTRHGVLVDVYGVGVLITGESGVGKSEAALELVKRGHRLVADDVVDIRRVSDNRLVGEAPEMIRHLMEIRGIGIIDVATMFGIGSVMRTRSIDLIVHLEHWVEGKEYDRVGTDEKTQEILDVSVPMILLPIRPGRNVAVVLEVAARNLMLKQQGYNAVEELEKRMFARLEKTAARAEKIGGGDGE